MAVGIKYVADQRVTHQGRRRPSVALHVPFNHCSSNGQDNGADLPENESMRLPVVLARFAAAIGFAATAQADPSGPDATFIEALNNAGITYQNAPDAIAIGRRACDLMDQGHAEVDVIKSMAQANPGFTDDAATRFTHIAESTYCPQYVNAPPQPQPAPAPTQPWIDFPWPAPPPAA
jgi:hypothetical protein